MSRIWSEAELAYLAGIVDGEGYLTVHRHKNCSYSTTLGVTNTDVRMIHWLHQHFGGSSGPTSRRKENPRFKPNWKPSWAWRATSSDLDLILRSLIPYLVVKKRQAELVIAYRATVNGVARQSRKARGVGRSPLPISNDVKAHRSGIVAELTLLNRKGAA